MYFELAEKSAEHALLNTLGGPFGIQVGTGTNPTTNEEDTRVSLSLPTLLMTGGIIVGTLFIGRNVLGKSYWDVLKNQKHRAAAEAAGVDFSRVPKEVTSVWASTKKAK